MQEIVKIMVKPLIASLAEKGIDLKLQASALKLLASQGYDPEMGARPLVEHCKQRWKTSWQNSFLRGTGSRQDSQDWCQSWSIKKFDIV